MSQAARIVALLRERPHTCAEILTEVPCIVHSRISTLRAKGFVIAHETTGPGASGSLYTLLSEPDRAETVVGPGGTAGSLSGVGDLAVTGAAVAGSSAPVNDDVLPPEPLNPASSVPCAAQLTFDGFTVFADGSYTRAA